LKENFKEEYLDFNHPHESNDFWVRLNQTYEASPYTLETLSETLGVSEKTLSRFLSKKTHNDVIRLIYDFSYACGVTPDALFNRKIQITDKDLIGIKSIDHMLCDVYSDASTTGIRSFKKYISKNYKLKHKSWKTKNNTKQNRVTSLLKIDEKGDPYLTYNDELELNAEVASANNHTKRLRLHSAFLVDEIIVVNYTIYETKMGEFINHTRTFQHIDHLTLDRPIKDYKQNGRLTPKIKVRQWSEIKTPLNDSE
tara:strand:+ start:414 stop:1175 length:762 start_codon:yes stop_codon:yes gene_type:complete